MLALNEAIEWG